MSSAPGLVELIAKPFSWLYHGIRLIRLSSVAVLRAARAAACESGAKAVFLRETMDLVAIFAT